VKLVYERRGSGEPLVLIHGIGSHWQVWRPVLDQLAAVRDVIAIDLPGFGASPMLPPETPSNIPSLAAAVAAFLDEQGIDSPHVAGNSLGGWVALELAQAGRVQSATGLSPAGFWNERELAFARASLRLIAGSARMAGRRAEPLLRTAAGRTATMSQIFAKPWLIPAEDAIAANAALANAPGFDATLEASIDDAYFRPGGPIDARVTIAWAQRDRLLIPRQARRAARMIPEARMLTLSGCGHVPMWDDPEQVGRVLLDGSRAR
jgi:pimeloyl-ACP methyl ester carboxylesterase